tara:strand:+ start:1288 stop:1485 length:198 start_codon:yes stop_codon:yes gene_type:complete
MRFSREELIEIIKQEMINTLKDRSSDFVLGEDGGQNDIDDYIFRSGFKAKRDIDLDAVLDIKYTG